MRITACQCLAIRDDRTRTIDAILDRLCWAEDGDVDLLLFSEAYLLGHSYDPAIIRSRATASFLDQLRIRMAGFASTLVIGAFEQARENDTTVHSSSRVAGLSDDAPSIILTSPTCVQGRNSRHSCGPTSAMGSISAMTPIIPTPRLSYRPRRRSDPLPSREHASARCRGTLAIEEHRQSRRTREADGVLDRLNRRDRPRYLRIELRLHRDRGA